MTRFGLRPRLTTNTPRAAPTLGLGWGLVCCALGLALGVASAAPARWLANGLAQATGQRVLLADAKGSVWTGNAVLALSPAADSSPDAARALPGRLSWRIRLGLAHGWPMLQLSLDQPCCMTGPSLWQISPAWGGAQVRTDGLAARWPAELLSGLGTPWNTLAFSGQVRLSSPSLALQISGQATRLQGQLLIEARDVASRISTVAPLGSYRLAVVGGDVVRLNLSTDAGALLLTGSGEWAVGAPFRFNGKASAAPQEQAALENLLNIIGRRSGPESLITIG